MQRIVAFVLAAVMVFSATAAFAFTPDDKELSSRLGKAYGALQSWRVEMSFPDFPDVRATVWQHGPRWRQEWSASSMKGKAVAVGSVSGVGAACPSDFPLPPTLFWNMPGQVEYWKSAGVDNATGGFGFVGDHPSLVIGADPGDESRPQVWLDNETMALLRVRLATSGGFMDIRFRQYAFEGGFQVPEAGEVQLASGRSVEFMLEWTDLNGAADPALYDAAEIRSAAMTGDCPAPPAPFDTLAAGLSAVPVRQE